MASPRLEIHVDAHTRLKAMAEDVVRGLTAQPKSLPPKYFYDPAGSRLFDEITRLPEYYLTRAEEAMSSARSPRQSLPGFSMPPTPSFMPPTKARGKPSSSAVPTWPRPPA